MSMLKHALRYIYSVIIILVITYSLSGFRLLAQEPNSWSPRQRIPGSHDLAETPYLVADQNRTVHAFHSQLVSDNEAIMAIVYSRWTIKDGWTTPIDVLLPFSGDLIFIHGAFLDRAGIMHIIFYCCDDSTPNIYYSQAPALIADRATAWSAPQLIGPNATSPHNATLAGDNQGNLFVVYAGNPSGKGIYAAHSLDGGSSWSDILPVFLTYDERLLPYGLTLQLDPQEGLHLVWVLNNSKGNGNAIYYARAEADHVAWNEPILLAMINENINRLSEPAITYYGDELIVIYLACEPCEKRMRRSMDGGQTWTDPVEPFQPSRGAYGEPAFLIDSNGTLHVIYGDRARGQTLFHSVWNNGYWLEPEKIVPLSEGETYKIGDPMAFTPTEPEAVISQGNVILVSWQLDADDIDKNGTWYSYTTLAVAELPLTPLPAQPAVETAAPTPTIIPPTPTPAPSPIAVLPRQGYQQTQSLRSPGWLLIFATLPVVLLISAFIFVRSTRSYSRY